MLIPWGGENHEEWGRWHKRILALGDSRYCESNDCKTCGYQVQLQKKGETAETSHATQYVLLCSYRIQPVLMLTRFRLIPQVSLRDSDNKAYHPGEKKLMRYTGLLCDRLPRGFNEKR